MNGRSSGLVCASTLTCSSLIASSRADCVRGVVRLISSASTTLAKIGPSLKSKVCVWLLKMETPSTSLGKRSGVSWMRLNLQSMLRASDLASTVLPTPGTSSMSTWPRASRPMIRRSTALLCPRKTVRMLSRSFSIRSFATQPPGSFCCCRSQLLLPRRYDFPAPRLRPRDRRIILAGHRGMYIGATGGTGPGGRSVALKQRVIGRAEEAEGEARVVGAVDVHAGVRPYELLGGDVA